MPTISFNLSNGEASRVANALGRYRHKVDASGTVTPATIAEVKEFVISDLQALVAQQERAAAESAVSTPSSLVVT